MSAYIEFENVLTKLEDKGYVKVTLIDDYWHYKKIICERQSIVNKLEEYLKKIDEADYPRDQNIGIASRKRCCDRNDFHLENFSPFFVTAPEFVPGVADTALSQMPP